MAAAAALLGLLQTACDKPAEPGGETLDLSAYEMTFDEPFREISIAAGSGARWSAHTPWHGDFGEARFADPGVGGPFIKSSTGLGIVAQKGTDGRWTSGLISSADRDGPGRAGFAQAYGYFEMKARLPEGMGLWPAFWLIGVDKTRSAAEIDVVEFYGGFPSAYHTVAHVWEQGHDRLAADQIIHVPPGQLSTDFNTFGVLIEPRTTRFYLNRRQVREMPTPPEFRQPMYVLADLALGGGWPIDGLKSPQTMQIAWIRAFTRPDLKAAAQEPAP